MSESLKTKRGVRQGCVLSPSLFNLYTEHIFRQIDELPGLKIGGRRHSITCGNRRRPPKDR